MGAESTVAAEKKTSRRGVGRRKKAAEAAPAKTEDVAPVTDTPPETTSPEPTRVEGTPEGSIDIPDPEEGRDEVELPDMLQASSEAYPPSPDKPIEQYTPREIGTEGEKLAASYLAKRGYEIIEQNWRCPAGEVDIIAHDEDDLVLVEVKTRLALGESSDIMPELAVDRRKQRRYKRLALYYLACHPDITSVRFDVIALNIVGERCARLRHLIGAYCWDE